MNNYKSLQEEAYEANMLLPKLGLVLFTFGNASVADRAMGVFAIKPSGVPYEYLLPDKIMIIDFEGVTVAGPLRPSSDTQTHAVLYKHWEKINGIVHTHSTYATAWAQAQRDIPVFGTTHADYLTEDIPCAAAMSDVMIKGNYEYETGRQIINCLQDRRLNYEDVQMMLVGNHAPFTWGKTVMEAVHNSAVLEAIAKMAYITEQLSPNAPRLKESLIRKHFERKKGPESYYGQK
jgi:L-ribulose-5-phosphate 4-epimerase